MRKLFMIDQNMNELDEQLTILSSYNHKSYFSDSVTVANLAELSLF